MPDLKVQVPADHIAILQKNSESERGQVPDDVAEYIARAIRLNICELEDGLVA